MNSIASAFRFFFAYTIDRLDVARKLIRMLHPRNLPVVLSRNEVARLLNATTGQHAMKPICTRQLHRIVDAAQAAEINQAGRNAHAAPQLRHKRQKHQPVRHGGPTGRPVSSSWQGC